MKYEAMNFNGDASHVTVCCDHMLGAYHELKGLVEEWAILVESGLATNKDFDSFLDKLHELQDEIREYAEDLLGIIPLFRRSLEDCGLSY